MMVRPLRREDVEVTAAGLLGVAEAAEEGGEDDERWVKPYVRDFRRRFVSLLGFEFRRLPCQLAFAVLQPQSRSYATAEDVQATELSSSELKTLVPLLERGVSPFDLKRLEGYARNLVDFHLVMDLVPTIAKLHFSGDVRHAVRLPHV